MFLKKSYHDIYHIIIKERIYEYWKNTKKIDETDYWDEKILDIKGLYFLDEITLIIDDEYKDTCWKIAFLSCYKVSYTTDASWRKIKNVKEMIHSQLGYYGQDISVFKSENIGFYKVYLDLSIMEMHIECKNISVDKISKKNLDLFWNYN